MKKTILIGAILLLTLSACVPDFLNTSSQEAPVAEVDTAATVDAAASTQAVQTFAALATPTLETLVEEPTATVTEESTPTETATATLTETPDGTPGTETPEGTLPAESATATLEGTLTPTETSTPAATATSVYPSPTSPISINLPPIDEVPRYTISVSNNTKGSAYISLHGSTEGGYKPIIEYDIPGRSKVKISVPEGFYTVIVYVGADPMVDYVGVHKNNAVSIAINIDKIKITK
ncbi:MAG: hypothetical protein HN855_16295 [Anaerolineae bacterium]|mgnify:FL=1|jgi:hypothetical protein|nr:hypothetical protein [Anaerolineae bacterium]MBT7069797.1 hypothetical protein [Anaerolineae bacterium]MBT7326711.1 hypothetical protein [Anaerolineae bacterium]